MTNPARGREHGPAAEPALVRPTKWNLPNTLTAIRILLVPLFGWLLLDRDGADGHLRVAAFTVFAVASLTDRVDGDLARRWNQVTDFGKMLDPIADKALMGMGFVGLSILDVIPWWVTIVVLGRELLITILRFVIMRYGVMAASRGGKAKTFTQAIALGMLVLPWGGVWHTVAMGVLVIAVVLTLATGVDYLLAGARQWRRGRAAERAA